MDKTEQHKALIECLCSFSEKELQSKIIEPLLQADHFRNVRDVSGPYEKGRDIIASKKDLGRDFLYVIQVKKLKISGRITNPKSLGVVVRQLEEAMAEPVFDPVVNSMRKPDRLIFITPYLIERATLEAAIGRIDLLAKMQVAIIDGAILVDEILTKIPRIAANLNSELSYQLNIIDKHKNITESTIFGEVAPLDIRDLYVNADYDCFSYFPKVIKNFYKTDSTIIKILVKDWISKNQEQQQQLVRQEPYKSLQTLHDHNEKRKILPESMLKGFIVTKVSEFIF